MGHACMATKGDADLSVGEARTMSRYLIVANQTLGGEQLDRTIQDRIERGDSQFFIVVPMTAPKHETSGWTHGFPIGDDATLSASQTESVRRVMEEDARRHEAELGEARMRAESRLSQMMEKVRSEGGEADGTVADADPAAAVKDVLKDQPFDEVIVSTLPAGISRWLKMDLPSRVARMTDAPVTTVEAEG